MEFNLYCDESCHLQNDGNDIMVIGGIWIPKAKRRELCEDIRHIKIQNRIPVDYELKWSKVSSAKRGAYIDLLNKFFDNPAFHFRGVIVRGKSRLDFTRYSGDYDDWYYKIYYLMIYQILGSDQIMNVYMDIKDTHSCEKISTLKKYISRKSGTLRNNAIGNFQAIRSEEVEIMQITDIIIGALSYYHRGLYGYGSSTKKELIDIIIRNSKSDLMHNSLLRDDKFNILLWSPDYHDR